MILAAIALMILGSIGYQENITNAGLRMPTWLYTDLYVGWNVGIVVLVIILIRKYSSS